jgi:predicted nucleic-acid-binding protein
MIGLDTNVVVRYLVQDDPRQSPVATRIIDSLSETSRGFISIARLGEQAGCNSTITFDRRASERAGMQLISS